MPQAPDDEPQLANITTAEIVSSRARQSVQFLPIRVGMTLAQGRNVLITATLKSTGGNVSKAAALLGIDRSTLHERIRRDNLRERKSKLGGETHGPEGND